MAVQAEGDRDLATRAVFFGPGLSRDWAVSGAKRGVAWRGSQAARTIDQAGSKIENNPDFQIFGN
jgi:hypothetical protein